MTDYIELLKSNENWLMNRVLYYSEKYEYTKYTSTLPEAWRLSISGLSNSLIMAANYYNNVVPELHPDDKFVDDPISAFGVIEAQKHRQRGTTLGMFLGLMKYFKESYIDLIEISSHDETKKTHYKKFSQRCFDRIEIAYCIEWTSISGERHLNELQDSNRKMTNEKNKYLTIFESLYVPIVLLDETFKISNLNQAAIELFTDLEVAGSIYYKNTASNSSFEQLNKQILKFLQKKPDESSFEAHLTTNKGEKLFQVKLKKMQDFSKKFSGTVVMLEDISDRKKVEEEISRQNSMFNALLKNLHIGVYMIEVPSGKPLLANEASFNLLGRGILPEAHSSTITKVYALYKSGTNIPYPNEELPLVEAMSGVSKHVDDLDVMRPDGTRTALEVFGSPIRNEKGTIWASLVSFQDITERKRSEKAIRESEEKFSHALQFAPFPIMLHAENGKVLAISQGWTDNSGYTLEDIPTIEDWTMHAYGSRMHIVKEDIDALYKIQGSKNEGEYVIKSKSGEDRIWDFSSAYLGNFDNTGRVVLSMAKDITDRKKAELALNISKERLTILNADKDRFISILGHDLKSPINNLLALTGLLNEELRELDSAEIEKFVGYINKSANTANDLLEDILMWARTIQGNISFSPKILIFKDACSNIIEVLKPSAFAKGISINCSIADHFNIYADKDMFRTIILNLVSNAIKFTNNGGMIDIKASQNNTEIIFTVSDNGVGIPVENQTKLFDISHVLTTKGTANETGTGLGLLLCKEFLEKHGGKIWVESKEGKGSDFKFTLPISANNANDLS